MREYKDTESCGSQQIAEAIINHVKLAATTCNKKEKLFPAIQFGFSQVFCHGNWTLADTLQKSAFAILRVHVFFNKDF